MAPGSGQALGPGSAGSSPASTVTLRLSTINPMASPADAATAFDEEESGIADVCDSMSDTVLLASPVRGAASQSPGARSGASPWRSPRALPLRWSGELSPSVSPHGRASVGGQGVLTQRASWGSSFALSAAERVGREHPGPADAAQGGSASAVLKGWANGNQRESWDAAERQLQALSASLLHARGNPANALPAGTQNVEAVQDRWQGGAALRAAKAAGAGSAVLVRVTDDILTAQ
ncbi:hypothetical protein WJX81_001195 [Elliptochloris bilobata]|uniref:Uncharacterized protein n=1 Tax=Elliptochloris bilobata TaxID=381761 RepID=A0AAW1S1R1_9CHLO